MVTDTCLLFQQFFSLYRTTEGKGFRWGGLRLGWRAGSVVIAHRSVILECFACVGLVLTTIVHRLVWPWYCCLDQMSIQRRLVRPYPELECGTEVSRSLVENHITTWCNRSGPC